MFCLLSQLLDFNAQKLQNERHSDVLTVLDLFPIGGSRILIDCNRELINTGERMEYGAIGLGVEKLFGGEDIAVFETEIILFVEEAFTLDSSHV